MLISRKIVIVGDSHTDAVKRALRASPGAGDADIQAYRYALDKNGKTVGDLSTDEISALVGSLGERDLVVSTIGGNQHQVVALMQHPQPFDIFSPDAAAENQSAQIIPYAQIFDFFETGVRSKDGARLQSLVAAARCKVAHCVPPPPKEDAGHIIRHHETYFANSGIAEKGVSPAALRLKVWQIQGEVLAQLATELGFELLWPPAHTLSAEGYLAPAYYADDATHGNRLYGSALIDQIVQTARAEAKESHE